MEPQRGMTASEMAILTIQLLQYRNANFCKGRRETTKKSVVLYDRCALVAALKLKNVTVNGTSEDSLYTALAALGTMIVSSVTRRLT
jgi:hypothetical protein